VRLFTPQGHDWTERFVIYAVQNATGVFSEKAKSKLYSRIDPMAPQARR